MTVPQFSATRCPRWNFIAAARIGCLRHHTPPEQAAELPGDYIHTWPTFSGRELQLHQHLTHQLLSPLCILAPHHVASLPPQLRRLCILDPSSLIPSPLRDTSPCIHHAQCHRPKLGEVPEELRR